MLTKNIKPEIERALESRKLEFGRMMKEFDKINQSGEFNYSKFWDFTHLLLKFIYDLSPKSLALIRQHVHHVSAGPYPLFDYDHNNFFGKSAEQLRQTPFIKKYLELISDIPKQYHYSEPLTDPISQFAAAKIDDKLVARDGLTHQIALTNLYNLGVFNELTSKLKRCKILEIGGGYGSLAYQMNRALKSNVSYVIVDLPSTLLFSGSFLTVNTRQDEIYFYDPANYSASKLPDIINKYRYILLPHYRLNDLMSCAPFDLIINMASFMEMTTEQVSNYLDFSHKNENCYFYSQNHSSPQAAIVPLQSERMGNSNSVTSHELKRTIDEEIGKYFSTFPKIGFYDQQGLSPHKTRIYLGHSSTQDFSKKFINKVMYGFGYKINGNKLELIDDILNQREYV